MRNQPYFNSGVMLVRDTPVSHNLYKEWYIQWQHSLNKGVNLDQPSMNYVNIQLGKLITELPGVWNCQIFLRDGNIYRKQKLYTMLAEANKKITRIIYLSEK